MFIPRFSKKEMLGQVILYYFFIRFSEGALPDVFKTVLSKNLWFRSQKTSMAILSQE